MIQLDEVPRADIHDHRGEGKRDDSTFEPDRSHVRVAVHQPHDEKDEGESEQVNVGNAYQRKDIGASVLLRHFLQVIVTAQVGNVRVAAIVTTDATLVQQRLDICFVFRAIAAVMHPRYEHIRLIARQHGRHRSAQRRFEARPLAAASVGGKDVVVRQQHRVTAPAPGIGVIQINQRE